MIFGPSLTTQAAQLLQVCRTKRLKLATAESCTGGLVAGVLTSIAGASDVFEAGLITYSNNAKVKLTGVPAGLIETHGAVSEETVRAMAERAIEAVGADIALAVTGIAGPGGGSSAKPVGLVHIAAARRGGRTLHRKLLWADLAREEIRLNSVAEALALGTQAANEAP